MLTAAIADQDGTLLPRTQTTRCDFPDDATFWYLSPFLNDPQKRWSVDPYMHCLVVNPFLKEFRERLAWALIALEVMPKEFSVVTGRKRQPDGKWQDFEDRVKVSEIRSTVESVLRLAEKSEQEGKALIFLGD